MRYSITKLIEFIGLFLLLTVERAIGLPVAFLMLLLLMTASFSQSVKLWVSVGWGILFAVVYVLPFWQAILLIAGGVYAYEFLESAISSDLRRLIGVAILQLVVTFFLTPLPISISFLGYHLLVLCLISIILFSFRLWKYRSGGLGFSQRYGLK